MNRQTNVLISIAAKIGQVGTPAVKGSALKIVQTYKSSNFLKDFESLTKLNKDCLLG